MIGVPYDLFWGDMTPKLLRKFSKAYDTRLQDTDRLNHTLGQYIAIGVNNASRYPKEAYLAGKKESYTPQDFKQLAKQRYSKKD